MASKSHIERSAPSATPPQISLSDQLLSSRITLPEDACIVYSIFTPTPASSRQPHESIELARRVVLSRNGSAALLDSMLTSVHIGIYPSIYIFMVATQSQSAVATSALKALNLEGLAALETSTFAPKDLYPCSSACSLLPNPCPTCLDRSRPSPVASTSSAIFLPRKPLRNVYSFFLEAVRIRLIDDIAETSVQRPKDVQRQVKRFKGGFLLGSHHTTCEWGSGWEYRALTRPLVYCHLQIYLYHQPDQSNSYLIVHPLVLPTHFLPIAKSLPLPAGTPITLLPHATPAFFLTQYAGPTSALTRQFQESLQGLGVSGWENIPPSPDTVPSGSVRNESVQQSAFIIAWISVENKQGEDKGIVIIYPTALCLSFALSSSPPRQLLNYIPELPAPLQPSPQVPHPSSPPSTHTELGISNASVARASIPSFRHPTLPSSPTSDSLRIFRTLTLSKSKDVRRVATEIGGYVDAVARERERERERLKRERESGIGGSPRLARTTTTTPASAPTPVTATDTPTPIVATMPTPTVSQPAAGPSHDHLQAPSQNFYPSPPQTNVPIIPPDKQTSPIAETTPGPPDTDTPSTLPTAAPSAEPTPLPGPASSTSNSSYDPFGNIDPTWSQPQPYMGMDIDMDFGMDMGMGFSMNMDSMSSDRGGGGNYNGNSGMDFEDAFTDDDFSFFDRPSRATVAPPVPAPVHMPGHRVVTSGSGLGLTPAAGPAPLGMGMSPPLFGDIHIDPGPLQQAPTPHSHFHPQPPPWPPNLLADGFSPRFADPSDGGAIPPDLLPPSPGQTPESHSAPVTPNIHLEHDQIGRRHSGSHGPSIFDPIPFSSYHRVADGKYAIGKFALPSPPDEEDRTEPLLVPLYHPALPITNANGWRFKYMAATDPRIGVVRKLIGVKRKMAFEPGARDGAKMSPAWIREHEDWERSAIEDEPAEETKSEPESDDDEVGDSESPIVSRPSTPAPAYLPLGATLLHTQFQHSHLLPLSTPLRPPGAAVAPTSIATAAPVTSVPTPVSPAATMGAASEKSKSLEAAAFTVATEAVENSVWGEAWQANTLGSRQPSEVWPADVTTICHLLEAVPALESPLTVATLFGLDHDEARSDVSSYNNSGKSLQVLESPMISIGKGDAVIQILPTALRFWEKLGLGPRGGRKDGTSFVLFEDDGEQRQQQVEVWHDNVVATYKGKHLGALVPGSSSSCPRDGLVPLRFDLSFRKSLASFVASLPASQSSLVIFIAMPISTMTLASPILRQVFSSVKKALKTYSEAQILFQFVPEQLILGSMEDPAVNLSSVEVLCYSVYNRTLIPVDRLMSRRFFEHGERVRKYFEEPALTLARPLHNRVSYVRAPHAPLDVVDRLMFVHVGYQVSPCGKWILAACVDQRGETHELGVWLTQTSGEGEVSDETYLVEKIWEFAVQFAKRANIEWRLVVARLGTMGESEANAWATLLGETCHELPMAHVTLVCVEPDAPWTFITSRVSPTPKRSPSFLGRSSSSPKHHPSHSVFTDISSTTYALFPQTHLVQPLPLSPIDLKLSLSFIPELPTVPSWTLHASTDATEHPSPHPLTLLPQSSMILIRVPSSPSPICISMLHMHLLLTRPSTAQSSTTTTTSFILSPEEAGKLQADITRNFHELAVLARARWKLGVNPLLPFHLAAVEAMRIALDRDRGGVDGSDG